MKANSYGKSRVRVTKVTRKPGVHQVRQMEVQAILHGAFEGTYITGDNSSVVATDSIKNTVYAVASDADIDSVEQFGVRLASHFVNKYAHVSRATIDISEELWDRIATPSGPHPTAFVSRGGERRTARVTLQRGAAPMIEGGIVNLSVLRTAGSEFSDFVTDEFRLLANSKDRIFATVVTSTWAYNTQTADFNATYRRIRDATLSIFGNHHSLSVQHTMHEVGVNAIRQCPEIEEIRMVMPNKHHIPFDLSRLGNRQNKNEIFVAVDEPQGMILETVGRARSKM